MSDLQFDDYQVAAQRTARVGMDFNTRLAVAALGLAGEAGEAADCVKKHLGQGHELDTLRILGEMGDVLWYLAELATILDADLSAVARLNQAKRAIRYRDTFTVNESVNRQT